MVVLALGFLLGGLGSIPPAGPVTALVFQRGVAGRSLDGLMVALGAGVGETLYCGLAVFGYGRVMDRWPALQPIMHVAGAVILVVAGLAFLIARHPPRDVRQPRPRPRAGEARQLLLGFSLTALNPSILVNWSAVVAAMHSTGLATLQRRNGLEFVAGACIGIVAWFGFLVGMLHRHRDRFPYAALAMSLRVLGAIMLGAGLYSTWRLLH
jgi:threonine/homoserine/homoserine lactone efflux protein